MASNDANTEAVGDNAAGTTVGDMPLDSNPVQNSGQSHQANDISMPDNLVAASETLAQNSVAELAKLVQTLNSRIVELEKNASVEQEGHQEEILPPELKAEIEQHRRMESCLYKHRKEWEATEGPGLWGISEYDDRVYMNQLYLRRRRELGLPNLPWTISWNLSSERPFPRLDHFNPSHDCADGQIHGNDQPIDDFDRTIDYGSRRDRLRKNFEWEMDRLYLNEELERRREEVKHQKQDDTRTKRGQGEKNPLPAFAKPELNRIQWFSFKDLACVAEEEACVIDILIGEPDIDEDQGGYRLWYGYSRPRARRPDAPQDVKYPASTTPGQSPLPERIRIHSAALSSILETLLGKTVDARDHSTFVLTRPFKALRYCEPALRDWCAALDKKFGVTSKTEQAAVVATGVSKIDPSEHEPHSHHLEPPAGQHPSQEPSREEMAAAADERLLSQGHQAPIGHGDQQEQEKKEVGNDNEDESSELTKSPVAMEHLKCLLSFIDTDIMARQVYLNDSGGRKIHFSDLWHVFRPGTEVIGSDGKQAYRVMHVTGAKHSVARDWGNYFVLPVSETQRKKKKKKAAFSITCVYIDFDGKHVGPIRKVFDMKKFDGEREITSLDVYPLRFHPVRQAAFSDSEWEETKTLPTHQRYRKKLARRGTKFLEVASVKHMYYAGPTLDVRDEVESQVVIDFETAFAVEDEKQQQWKPTLATYTGGSMAEEDEDSEDSEDEFCSAECCRDEIVHDDSYVDDKQSSEFGESLLPKAGSLVEQPSIAIIPRTLEEVYDRTGEIGISEDDLAIMSYRVFGFVLRNRKWAKLDLTYLTDVHRPEKKTSVEGQHDVGGNKEKTEPVTAFDRLVLEKWHRPMIESLIAQHFRDKKSTTGEREEFDIVKGKGKGLIMLLHGAPGVGKTSTAEGVAELFQKPLFQITCGDLGDTAWEVEKALETNFALANRWDCILLLDEADVFLAERTKEDFRRNGLVAVFLRVMEYYAGILFLTTNRVGDFDEAFTSRIHVSLLYRELNREKTIEVFKINMDMIEQRFKKRGRSIKIDRMGIGSFADQHFNDHPKARWNGRQIRNACQTALALAEYKAHGKVHDVVPTAEVAVTLGLEEFETVRDAYVEFTQYINDLFRADAAQRARDNQLRAIWIDENNNLGPYMAVGGTMQDQKKADFLLSTQAPSLASRPQQSPPPTPQQQRYSQRYHPQQSPPPQPPHQQYQQYHQYQNLNVPQSAYPPSTYGQAQAQHFPPGQSMNYSGGPAASTSFQGAGEEEQNIHALQQSQHQSLTTPPHQQNPHQNVQQVINRGVHAMYEPSGQQPPSQPF